MSLLCAGTSPKTLVYSNAHNHPCYEIILNTAGEGAATIGDREYSFLPGTIMIIPPYTPHTKHSKGGFLDLYIHTDTLAPMPLCDGSAQDLSFYENIDGELSVLMRMILCRYLEKNKNDTALKLMYELFMQMLAEKCAVSQLDPAVEEVRRHLTMHFNDPELSLSAVLADAPYHKDHIRRRFTAVYGMTPGEYLTELRIENAKNLLQKRKELGFSISEIGAMCGYYDGHYFSRVFKSRTGISPVEYQP